jgi:predicted RNA-binding Zn-ribbon protein involved in translation (DUF1610 family)
MKTQKTYTDDCRKHNITLHPWECPKCGWNALSNDGIEQGYCEMVDFRNKDTSLGSGSDWQVKCTCPICGEEFEYSD